MIDLELQLSIIFLFLFLLINALIFNSEILLHIIGIILGIYILYLAISGFKEIPNKKGG